MTPADAPGGGMWAPMVIEADMMTRRVDLSATGVRVMLTVVLGVPAFLFLVAPLLVMTGYLERSAEPVAQTAFGVVLALGWILLLRGTIARVRRTLALHRLRIDIGGGGVMLRLPAREVTVMLQDIARVAVRVDAVRGLFGARSHYTSAIGLTDGKWIVLGAVTRDRLGALIGQATEAIAHARGVAVEDLGAAGWSVPRIVSGATVTV